jgi:phage terminase large subunit GpA-like protein
MMRVAGTAIDSGGAPGVTSQAYKFWRAMRKAGLGRQVMLTKGTGKPTASRLAKTFPDARGRRDRKAARGDVPVWQFQTDKLKDELKNQLEAEVGEGLSVHFPAELLSDQEGTPHEFFEELAAEERGDDGKWKRIRKRNEALDLMVMSHTAALRLGIDKVDWTDPPTWAAPADANDLVGDAEVQESLGLDAKTPAETGRGRRRRSGYKDNF